MFRFLWSSGYICRRYACPLVSACLPVRLSIRLSVRPSVGRSVGRSVRCLPQRTSDECIAVWPRPEGSLTDYHLVFMVFEVLLNHLAASLLRVRLPSFPPSPSVPSRPRCRRRWRRHGVHRGTVGKENRRDEERCERATRTSGPSEAGVNNTVRVHRGYTFAQCESLMHRRVGTRTVVSPPSRRSFRRGDERRELSYAYCYNELRFGS